MNNCQLTRMYFWRNGGGQEGHCCRNPSEGDRREHCRWSGREDYMKLFFPVPPPRSAIVVDPHLHCRISIVDLRDPPFPGFPIHRAMSQPFILLINRATSSSPPPLPWQGHRGYSPQKIPHESDPQPDSSSEAPSKVPYGGTS